MASILKTITKPFELLCRTRRLNNWATLKTPNDFSHFSVYRTYEKTKFYVDLYWRIVQKDDSSNKYTIYERVKWDVLQETIKRIESTDLIAKLQSLENSRKEENNNR